MIKRFVKERLGTIILFLIVILFVAWGAMSIKKARENAVTYNVEYTAPEENVNLEDAGSYVSVAKSDKLELFYNEAKGAIQVKDLVGGCLWKSLVDEEVYDLEQIPNAQWVAYVQSPITITYSDLEKRDSGVKKLNAASDCKWLETEYINGGVRVTYGFLSPGIFVTVEYVLDSDELVVRIPADGIREESKFALTTIELMPYLGAAGNGTEGYLFYPDGSGAITTYENASARPSNVKGATFFTYTNKTVNFMNMWNEDTYNRYTAAMPVYGVKNGDNAMFAVFSKGEGNTGIAVYPSGYVLDINHIGFEVYTRNVFAVDLYSMSTAAGSSVTGGTIQRVDKNLINEDREARYFFLCGEDASYSGMASTYRSYLQEKGMLREAGGSSGMQALALELLMGTTKDGMIFDEYIAMTDFGQVQEILERLQNSGVTDTQVVLASWMSDYDDYEIWGPARQLGGKRGLKNLGDYLESHPSASVYLGNDFTFATSDTSGISEDRDVARDGLNVEVAVENMSGLTYYLLNPQASYRRNETFLKKLSGYDRYGVAYTTLGQYAYADYNEKNPFTKTETVEKLKEILTVTDREGRKIAVQGANDYTFGHADYLYGMREDSYGLSITDYSVPFMEMVVSGLIPYSTDGAGNLAYDLQRQKLKWIEYGAVPYFRLTYESALKLRDTYMDDLFSSTYEDWEGTVVDTYREFQNNLSGVWGEQLIKHEILTEDLVQVVYADGTTIYINYGSEEASADGVTVPAKDYVVVGGGK